MSAMSIIRKRVISPCVPAFLQRRLRYWNKCPRRTMIGNNKHSIHRRHLQPNVELEVYWLDAPLGSGPAASLYVDDDEVMRIDCLGRDTAHMHLNMKQAQLFPGAARARLWFPPGSPREHADRARHELVHNLDYALRTNRRPKIRRMRVDSASLVQAGNWMHEIMNRLVDESRESVAGSEATGGSAAHAQPAFRGP